MNEPKKSGLPDDNFQDPLEDYEPQEYSDPVERALGEERVASMNITPYASVSPDTPIRDAIRQMADMHHACLGSSPKTIASSASSPTARLSIRSHWNTTTSWNVPFVTS